MVYIHIIVYSIASLANAGQVAQCRLASEANFADVVNVMTFDP